MHHTEFPTILDTLQRKMVRAGMNDEASYDHSTFVPLFCILVLTVHW